MRWMKKISFGVALLSNWLNEKCIVHSPASLNIHKNTLCTTLAIYSQFMTLLFYSWREFGSWKKQKSFFSTDAREFSLSFSRVAILGAPWYFFLFDHSLWIIEISLLHCRVSQQCAFFSIILKCRWFVKILTKKIEREKNERKEKNEKESEFKF